MATMKCILGCVVLLAVSAWTEAGVLRNSTNETLTVFDRLMLVNKDLGQNGNVVIVDGDIADDISDDNVRNNGDPCVDGACKWPMLSDGTVVVPYVIDEAENLFQLKVILVMSTFIHSTCIRFIPRTNERDYLHIKSLKGCWSYIGRRGDAQELSLQSPGCMNAGTIQHELLHALGFHHEHKRGDRDQHIRVIWDNIEDEQTHNFERINTLNQGTPYDYNSVMQYSRYAFTKNSEPTLEAVPDNSVKFGDATEMSANDIERINRVYCGHYRFLEILRNGFAQLEKST